MTRTELHNATVDRLFEAIRTAPSLRPMYHVLRRVIWAPDIDFPKSEHLFDIVLTHGTPSFTVEGDVIRLTGRNGVTTVIDVLGEDIEAEFYDKPWDLQQSSTCEYVLFDPSGLSMRPNLDVAEKRDGEFHRARSTKYGVFFSTAGFRLDVHGAEFTVSRSGRPWVEEDLLKCRKVYEKNPNPALAAKIRQLEEKAMQPMREPDE